MKHNLNLLSILIISIFMLDACSSGSSSSSNDPSTTPLTGNRVEADVVNGKVVAVREYAIAGNGKEVLVFNGLPHGSHAERHLDKIKYKVVTHYYKDRFEFRSERAKLDNDYATDTNNSTNSAKSSWSLNSVKDFFTGSQNSAKSAKSTSTTGSNFYTGFDIGYNPSIKATVLGSGDSINFLGNIQPTCYFYTPQLSGGLNQQEFSTIDNLAFTNSSGSNANTFNDKLSIGGSYGLFSASNKLAYSNSYQGSYANGSFSFINAAVANVSFEIGGLSDYALAILEKLGADQFEATCGSSVITSMPMGWGFSVSLNVSSSDSKETSSISDTLKASYSFVSAANSLKTTNTSSQSGFNVTYSAQPMGDYTFRSSYPKLGIKAGDTYQDTIEDWIAAHSQNLSDCMKGGQNGASVISAACAADMTAFNNEISSVLAVVQADVDKYGLPKQIGFMDAFPNGISVTSGNGITATATEQPVFSNMAVILSLTDAASKNSANVKDSYANYSANLNNYIQIIWQIEQLAQAAYLDANYLTGAKPSLTMANMPVDAIFTNLGNSYQNDVNNLVNLIAPCFENVSNCKNLPQMTATNSYEYYSNSSLFSQLEPTVTDGLLNDKLVNSVLLQYQGQYQENASLSNPKNTWKYIDGYYVGNPTPEVNNTVPMAIVYSGNTGTANLPAGLLAIATGGLTMNNPFCSIGTSGCMYERYGGTPTGAALEGGPLSAGSTMLATQPFYYILPQTPGSNGFASLIGQSIASGQNLSSYFLMAVKYINGAISIDAPAGFNAANLTASQIQQNTVYGQNGNPTAATNFNINPAGNSLPSFAITSAGNGSFAAGPTARSVNGIFGPIGNSNGLYSLLNGSSGLVNVSTIMANWILTLPDYNMQSDLNSNYGCYGNTGVYSNFSGCDGTGLYPYNDSNFTINAPSWGPVGVKVNSTANTLSFTPINSFFN